MTVAVWSARTALRVSSSGSPGPAPTRVTRPSWPSGCAANSVSRSWSVGSRAALAQARSTNRSQNPRRAWKLVTRSLSGSRHAFAARPHAAMLSGSTLSTRARIDCPSIGAAPSVEIATMTGERLTIVPKVMSQYSVWSIMLTSAPAPCAAAIIRSASARSSGDPTTSAAPAKSSGVQASARCSTSAPAAASSSAFHSAPSDAPCTTTLRPPSR